MKNALIFFSFLFFSCKDSAYYQHFSNYNDFSKLKSNKRVSGKFPDIIKEDAFDLKSYSYIEKNFFSKFKYSDNKNYDSIFSNKSKITFLEFDSKIEKLNDLKPNWFIEYDLKDSLNFETVRINYFYILRNKSKKEIFSFTLL